MAALPPSPPKLLLAPLPLSTPTIIDEFLDCHDLLFRILEEHVSKVRAQQRVDLSIEHILAPPGVYILTLSGCCLDTGTLSTIQIDFHQVYDIVDCMKWVVTSFVQDLKQVVDQDEIVMGAFGIARKVHRNRDQQQ